MAPHPHETPCEREAILFGKYLIDCEPEQEMIHRYVRAVQVFQERHEMPQGDAVLDFSIAHSWSIPLLDAACGILDVSAPLRRRIYIMAAILEASPRYAEQFLFKRVSLFAWGLRLLAWGFIASIKAGIGIPIYLYLRGSRRG